MDRNQNYGQKSKLWTDFLVSHLKLWTEVQSVDRYLWFLTKTMDRSFITSGVTKLFIKLVINTHTSPEIYCYSISDEDGLCSQGNVYGIKYLGFFSKNPNKEADYMGLNK